MVKKDQLGTVVASVVISLFIFGLVLWSQQGREWLRGPEGPQGVQGLQGDQGPPSGIPIGSWKHINSWNLSRSESSPDDFYCTTITFNSDMWRVRYQALGNTNSWLQIMIVKGIVPVEEIEAGAMLVYVCAGGSGSLVIGTLYGYGQGTYTMAIRGITNTVVVSIHEAEIGSDTNL